MSVLSKVGKQVLGLPEINFAKLTSEQKNQILTKFSLDGLLLILDQGNLEQLELAKEILDAEIAERKSGEQKPG